MVRSSILLYLICYMLKKIKFQKNFELPIHRIEISILLKIKWNPAPASSWSWSGEAGAGADCPLIVTVLSL